MTEITNADKLAVLHNELLRKRGATYADLSDTLNPPLGGRYAVEERKITNTVPHQPIDSPWHHDPVGPEPSLGYSVDAMPVVGTPTEIEQAAQVLRERSLADGPQADAPAPEVVSSLPAEGAGAVEPATVDPSVAIGIPTFEPPAATSSAADVLGVGVPSLRRRL